MASVDMSVAYMACTYNTHVVSNPTVPKTFKEIFKLLEEEKKKWLEAVRSEIMNFVKRNSWIKTQKKDVLAAGKKPIGVKHVFKIKDKSTGLQYKDRIVVKGYMSIPGVDYTESFSPVMTDAAIRILIILYFYFQMTDPEGDWVLWPMDYKAAFLNADLDKDIYINTQKE